MVTKLCTACKLKKHGLLEVLYHTNIQLQKSHQRLFDFSKLPCRCDVQKNHYKNCKSDKDEMKDKLYDKLKQFIGYEVEVELENYETVRGKVHHVGKNFMELLVKEYRTDPDCDDKDGVEEYEIFQEEKVSVELDSDSDSIEDLSKNNYSSYLFLIDKITRIKTFHS